MDAEVKPLIDEKKLTIINEVIHYKIRQQDDSFQPMTIRDTFSNRAFVAWVQIHESSTKV